MSKISSTLCAVVLALSGCGDSSHGAVKKVGLQQNGQGQPQRLEFVTKDQKQYSFPIKGYESGVVILRTGNQENPLRFYEAGPVHRFNVELNDFFVLTDPQTGITRVLQYFGIATGSRRLFFDDPARGGAFSVRYDSATRIASISVGTKQFKVVVESFSPFRLKADQNGDNLFRSDKVPIVTYSGSQIKEEDLR